jgi:hypothetical protein
MLFRNVLTTVPDSKGADGDFCAVKWENSDTVVVVPTSAVLKTPEDICLNDVRTIELNGWHRKGKIILKGKFTLHTIVHYVFIDYQVRKVNARLCKVLNLRNHTPT